MTKATNCILAASAAELAPEQPVMPCIRCGACADACPADLLPQQLYWHARAKEFDKAQDYHLFSCIECGCCSYVCPSRIPLVQYYRYAKNEIWAQEKEKQKAELARQRHQARLERLEREKQERDAKPVSYTHLDVYKRQDLPTATQPTGNHRIYDPRCHYRG